MEAQAQRCLVYLRRRPPTEKEKKETPLFTLTPDTVKMNDGKVYKYDGTLGADTTQQQVFDMVAKPCVNHALSGFRSALMAYGQTGTGKSHTMCNNRAGEEGIIPRAAQMLFDAMASAQGKTYSMVVQFLQIYRDNLSDLMNDSGRDRVDIVCEADKGVTLPGCSTHEVKSVEQFMKIYREGDKRRVTAATAMNPESSRGHTALVVWVVGRTDAGSEQHGKITFIDLAGYERFSKTGISEYGVMREEAKTINASLLALGHVVTALSNHDRHIPWRNSRLTRLLQDSIGGQSRTTIILTVGPSAQHEFETTNTLQFGMRAMAVKVAAKAQETVNYEHLAAKLQALLNEREERINALELQNAAYEVAQEELNTRHERDLAQLRARQDEEVQGSPDMTPEQIAEFRKRHEMEIQTLLEQQKEELTYAHEQNQQQQKEITDRLVAEHEREVAELELRIQDLEDEVAALKANAATAPAGGAATAAAASSAAPPPSARSLNATQVDSQITEEPSLSDTYVMRRSSSVLQLPKMDEGVVKDGVVDASVYQRMVDQCAEAMECGRRLVVDLQVRLDKALKLSQQRAEDLAEMEKYAAEIKAKNKKMGEEEDDEDEMDLLAETISNIVEGRKSQAAANVPNLKLQLPKVSQVNMIDAKVHEQMLDQLRNEIKEKDNQIEMLMAGAGVSMASMTNFMTPRVNLDNNMFTPQTSRGGGGGGNFLSSMMYENLKTQVQMLQEQLQNAQQENMILRDELEVLRMGPQGASPAKPTAGGGGAGESASPEASGVSPVMGKKPLVVSKAKVDLSSNPLIVELRELRAKVEEHKKEKKIFEQELGALVTQLRNARVGRLRNHARSAWRPSKKLADDEILVPPARSEWKKIVDEVVEKLKKDPKLLLRISGIGAAAAGVVSIAETVKRRLANVHQITNIGEEIVQEVYESFETEKIYEFSRHEATIQVTLATRPLDRKHPGYQPPIDQQGVESGVCEAEPEHGDDYDEIWDE